LPSEDRDELLGAPLLVLEAAEAHRLGGDAEAPTDPLHRLEGRELLLVHQIDAPRPLGVPIDAVGLADDEVLGALLDFHLSSSSVDVVAGHLPRIPQHPEEGLLLLAARLLIRAEGGEAGAPGVESTPP